MQCHAGGEKARLAKCGGGLLDGCSWYDGKILRHECFAYFLAIGQFINRAQAVLGRFHFADATVVPDIGGEVRYA